LKDNVEEDAGPDLSLMVRVDKRSEERPTISRDNSLLFLCVPFVPFLVFFHRSIEVSLTRYLEARRTDLVAAFASETDIHGWLDILDFKEGRGGSLLL
jgi:hypothetical protein